MEKPQDIFGTDWTKLARTEEEESEHQKELRKIKQERINQYGFYVNCHLRIKDLVTLKTEEANGIKKTYMITAFMITDKDLLIRITDGTNKYWINDYMIGTGKIPE